MVMHTLLLLGIAWALRETQASRAEVEMFERGKKFKLPRKCDGWKFDSSKCCSCGPRNGQRVDQELEAVIDTCEVEKKGVVEGAPCCPVWATDCKEDEPEFKLGLKRDCVVTKADCYEAQCHDAKETLDSTLRALEILKREKPKGKTYQEEGHVTGKSSSGVGCSCGCGDIADPKSMTCQLLEKTVFCKKPKKCCSNLKDCSPSDPWPKAVADRSKEVKLARSDHSEKVKQLETEVADLKQLLKDCIASCKVTQQKACLDDLKETSTVTSSGWFGGDKEVTRQELIMQDFYSKLHKKAQASQQERDEWMQEAVRKEKDRQKESNEKRKKKWRKETYANLHNFASGTVQALSDAVRGKECCKCTMRRLFTFATDFCSAPSCAVYEGKCSSISKSFCGKRYTACPADHTYYARAVGMNEDE